MYLFTGRAGAAFPGEHAPMELIPEDTEKLTTITQIPGEELKCS